MEFTTAPTSQQGTKFQINNLNC